MKLLNADPVRVRYADIGIRRLSRWIFNCYIVEDGGAGQPFIVDAGLPSLGLAALDELTGPMNRAPYDLATLTATHLHSDHVGGMAPLHDATRAQVVIPGKANAYMKGEVPRPIGLREVVEFRPFLREQPFDPGALVEALACADDGVGGGRFSLSAPIHGLLEDDKPLLGAPEWVALSTPGHTDCSACLWNGRTGTLISGDTVLTLGGRAAFNPEHIDPLAMRATQERLRALPVKHLLPGHGIPLSGPNIMRDALTLAV